MTSVELKLRVGVISPQKRHSGGTDFSGTVDLQDIFWNFSF